MEKNKPISHFVAGLVIAAILVVYSLLLFFLDMSENRFLSWLSYLIFIIGLIVFIQMYGKANDYRPGFGNLFGYGFKISAIVTLIVILFTILFFIAFPEFKVKIMEATRTSMEEQNRKDDEIDQYMKMMENYFYVFMAAAALFGYLLVGAIGSLIGAAVTKKNPQSPFEQTSF